MARYRSHSIEFKRQIAQEFLAGDTLHGLEKRHDISRNLIRVWVERYQAGAFDEDAAAADLLQQYEARIAALERLVGKQALELEFLRGGSAKRTACEKRAYISDLRPEGVSVAEGCRLMGISRSTYYDLPVSTSDDTRLVEAMSAIRDAFERYGWRRMQAALRQQGIVVNQKKVKRLMREHDLQPRMRRRYTATTDSDHGHPIFRNLVKDKVVDGPNQRWVVDITYVAVDTGFVYVAVILDAWSRRVVGYALSRSIDVRLTLAALHAAIEDRRPPPGCLHHTDRGSQYAALAYRQTLNRHGLVGSMGRRGNPYDNAKAESFMKTLEVEAVYPMACETFADVAGDLPRFIDQVYNTEGFTQPSAISAPNSSRTTTLGRRSIQRHDLCPPTGAHSKTGSLFHAETQSNRAWSHPTTDAVAGSFRT